MTINNILQIDLIKELGLEKLSDEEKEQIVLKMGAIVQQNILLRVLGELDEKSKDEFDKILGENDNVKVLQFLQSKIPNLDELIKEEIAKFKESVVERMQGLIPQN